ALQFNTATRDLTIETNMVRELPSATRNPFQLALLDPTNLNRGSTIETQPYHHRTANELDLGGGTKYRNDILLDGSPPIAGNKVGYTPPMNALTDRAIRRHTETPYWNVGGTLGGPIIKNKLFAFGVYEKIENGQASPGTYTLPTALERAGDFSQSLTTARALRVIYDPTTTSGATRLP